MQTTKLKKKNVRKSNRPVRRRGRRGRRARPSKPSTWATSSLETSSENLKPNVDDIAHKLTQQRMKIDQRFTVANRPRMGLPGLRFCEAVLNPFASGLAVGPKNIGATYPCGSGRGAVPITVTHNMTYVGSTATSGWITMFPLCYTGAAEDFLMGVFYGGDPTSAASSPTGIALPGPFAEATSFNGFVPAGTLIRVIASGLRVTAISAADTVSGILEGSLSLSGLGHAGAYSTYAAVNAGIIEESRNVSEGMTVRGLFDHQSEEPATILQHYYDARTMFPRLPCIRFSGLLATTTLHISAVYHIEVFHDTAAQVFVTRPKEYEPDLHTIVAFTNSFECVVGGHTFWSFLKRVGQGLVDGFHFVDKNVLPVVREVISTVEKVL